MPLFSKPAYAIVSQSEAQSYFTSPRREEEQDVSCFLRTEFSDSTLEGMANQLWRQS